MTCCCKHRLLSLPQRLPPPSASSRQLLLLSVLRVGGRRLQLPMLWRLLRFGCSSRRFLLSRYRGQLQR